MAVGMFFLVLVGIIIAVIVGTAIAANRSSVDANARRELKAERAKLRLANQALRVIASGTAGNPTYEAQDALDRIDDLEMKELN